MVGVEWGVDWVVVGAIASVATAAVLAGGAALTIRQLSHAVRERHSALILRLSERWDSQDMEQSRQAIATLHSQNIRVGDKLWELESQGGGRGEYYDLLRVGSFFEDLGMAVTKDWISAREAEERFGPAITNYWPLYEGYASAWDTKDATQGVFLNFQRLYHEVRKARQKRITTRS